MMDREKVIKEIEDALSDNLAKAGAIYRLSLMGLKDKALTDVLALLKEQDAVEPEFVRNEWRCGACGHVVLTYCFDINEGEMGKIMANYCPSCGRKVKWE